MIFHWGLYSIPGIVESWSICSEDVDWINRSRDLGYEEYKQWYWGLKDRFDPSSFDPEEWAEIMEEAGMRYMIFTTKHHDGFCMFDTGVTDFSIAATPFFRRDSTDITLEILEAFRDKGFMVGTYFSKPDWHCGYYWWDQYATADRASLRLMGDQYLLLEALAATGKPLITVYIQGRPLDMRDASSLSDALLTAWYPGEQGGTAIASVLFGDTGPSWRLPISVPLDAGQLPAYYSQGSQSDYTDMPSAPLYPFGYGLTYTEFEYGKISIDTADFHNAGNLRISVRITNTGTRHGTETVQLYIRDKVSSYRVCDLRLAAFERVSLAPGESSVAEFTLDKDALAYYFPDGRKVFEDGEFEIMAGASSTDIRSTEILKMQNDIRNR